MTVGTKSVLFGVHHWLIHPILVLVAWRRLYGWPSWQIVVCAFVHDLGYLGKPNMDGPEGERHPEMGARIAKAICGPKYADLVLLHSRHYARDCGLDPSALCWADKASHLYETWWSYLPRAMASGELHEYRRNADRASLVPRSYSHRQWWSVIQDKFRLLVTTREGTAVPYCNAKDGAH
jgi:hypothetical protein